MEKVGHATIKLRRVKRFYQGTLLQAGGFHSPSFPDLRQFGTVAFAMVCPADLLPC